jgi:hypothetical protein
MAIGREILKNKMFSPYFHKNDTFQSKLLTFSAFLGTHKIGFVFV